MRRILFVAIVILAMAMVTGCGGGGGGESSSSRPTSPPPTATRTVTYDYGQVSYTTISVTNNGWAESGAKVMAATTSEDFSIMATDSAGKSIGNWSDPFPFSSSQTRKQIIRTEIQFLDGHSQTFTGNNGASWALPAGKTVQVIFYFGTG